MSLSAEGLPPPSGRTTTTAARVPLDVLLTVSPDLAETARRVMVTESARIWARQDVELQWAWASGGAEPPSAALRVLVIPGLQSTVAGRERWPVAELLTRTGSRALAIASITGARRVVDETLRFGLPNPPGLVDHRLGLVLGRAIAHEIGHFLLGTSTHAERGLMRASVEAREFAALDAGAFLLDDDASQWIRERSTKLAAAGAGRHASFSYRR